MKPLFFNEAHTRTKCIALDTKKCNACWECIENCSNQVIAKVDLPWHKHALIAEPDNCTGCLKCIQVCQYEAYSKIDNTKHEALKQRKRTFRSFLVNNLLLLSGLIMIISGLAMQLGFHMGESGRHPASGHEIQRTAMQYEQLRGIDPNKTFWGINYSNWSTIHKVVIVIFSLLMIYHFYIHWKWYKGVIGKRLIGKNIQVITLSVLFLIVAITGFIPWFIDLSGSKSMVRLVLIEIHDKLTLILIIYFILHLVKRKKWYHSAYAKLRNK